MRRNLVLVLLFFIIMPTMVGCAAVGVPHTTNPDKKLRYAETLFNELDRPLPAQTLILEAINKYKRIDDEIGLANAYRIYAFFLQSPTVSRWSKMKFDDHTINYENRYEKAVEYWHKAINLYDKNQMYNLSADCYFQLEKLYYIAFSDLTVACTYNGKSKQSILKFRESNSDTKLNAMGFDSFEEFIDEARKQLGCK